MERCAYGGSRTMASLLLLIFIATVVSGNDQTARVIHAPISSKMTDLPAEVPGDPKEEDRCKTDFVNISHNLSGTHECQKYGHDEYKLVCVGKYKEFTSYREQDLEIEICKLKDCKEYCKEEDGRECIEEECVCKRSHFTNNRGECIPYCLKKDPCQNGGKCTLSDKAPFICGCKPGFKGPLCEFEDVLMAHTIRNTVIVGVVFGVLIVICLAVAILIVQRLKNKIAMKENSSEVYENMAADL